MTGVVIDDYVLDVLMRDLVGHDRAPSAYLLYLHLWRLCGGRRPRWESASLTDLAEATGISRRSIQDSLRHLEKRGLLERRRAGVAAVHEFRIRRPW